MGPEHEDTINTVEMVIMAYLPQGKFSESEPLAREVLDFYRRKQPDTWFRFLSESMLGASLAGLKRYAEAEPLLLDGYQGMLARKARSLGPAGMSEWNAARKWIVELYEAWGKPEMAAEWRKKMNLLHTL